MGSLSVRPHWKRWALAASPPGASARLPVWAHVRRAHACARAAGGGSLLALLLGVDDHVCMRVARQPLALGLELPHVLLLQATAFLLDLFALGEPFTDALRTMASNFDEPMRECFVDFIKKSGA